MPVPFKRGHVGQIRIDDLAFGGKGVGRVEGFVVLVDGCVPGDLVEMRVEKVRGNYAEGRTVGLVEPSSDRIDARCTHFGTCGGCRWQSLPYEIQIEYKRRQVVEALKRIGGFEDPPVEPTLPSPDTFYYRNKMEFSFGKDSGGNLTLGLHPASSYREVFDLEACHLQSELSNVLVFEAREAFRSAGLEPYDVRSHRGFLRYLTIREGKFTGETMVNVVTGDGGARDERMTEVLKRTAEAMCARHPEIRSFLRSVNATRSTIAVGQREQILHGGRVIHERLLGRTFEITANSFFQTNSRQAERLYESVLELAEIGAEDRVLDLYSGTGAISLLAAGGAREVRGVESQAESVRNAERNASLNGISNVHFIRAEARKALSAMTRDSQSPDVIIVNPPRAGLNASVIRHMMKLCPRRLVYVSCNPTTLARDLEAICERDYRLSHVRPVDMFPHTYHIECVARIDRTSGENPL